MHTDLFPQLHSVSLKTGMELLAQDPGNAANVMSVGAQPICRLALCTDGLKTERIRGVSSRVDPHKLPSGGLSLAVREGFSMVSYLFTRRLGLDCEY